MCDEKPMPCVFVTIEKIENPSIAFVVLLHASKNRTQLHKLYNSIIFYRWYLRVYLFTRGYPGRRRRLRMLMRFVNVITLIRKE